MILYHQPINAFYDKHISYMVAARKVFKCGHQVIKGTQADIFTVLIM